MLMAPVVVPVLPVLEPGVEPVLAPVLVSVLLPAPENAGPPLAAVEPEVLEPPVVPVAPGVPDVPPEFPRPSPGRSTTWAPTFGCPAPEGASVSTLWPPEVPLGPPATVACAGMLHSRQAATVALTSLFHFFICLLSEFFCLAVYQFCVLKIVYFHSALDVG